MVEYVRVRLLQNTYIPLRFQHVFQFGDTLNVLKFLYEKLRNFCSICGLLSHEALICPQNGTGGPSTPADDDDDNEDHPFFNPEEPKTNGGTKPLGEEETKGDNEEYNPNSSKKRKTEDSLSHPMEPSSLICYDMRHVFASEDTQQCITKRQRRQFDVMEVRNWYTRPLDRENTSSQIR